MPSRLIRFASLTLKSGKSMTTTTSGRFARAQATRRRMRRIGLRNLLDGLGQAGDGERPVVFEDCSTGRGKLRTGQAADADAGIERAQLAHERARVQIARRLAARDQKTRAQRRQEPGRVNRRGSSGVLMAISLRRRFTIGLPSARTSAVNATRTPSTGR